ncbi:MAG: MOSC domain-containing protein [Gemmatimonadaceae bacterium]
MTHAVSVTQAELGSVVSLWRYPVKSMMGEELNATEVTDRGLLGDRAFAVVDSEDGKVVTAKNPRKWPNFFDFRAELAGSNVNIALPDGEVVNSAAGNVNHFLSKALGRDVTLRSAPLSALDVEEYWPDIAGLSHRDTFTDFTLAEGTFFDAAVVHVLTTSTIDRLRELYPQGRFEARRFRPNIVVQLTSGEKGFAEDGWVGHTVAIGADVKLSITRQCGRCVMTTLAQGDLPKDTGILRTAAEHNRAKVGVYAAVVRGGKIRRGDRVGLIE